MKPRISLHTGDEPVLDTRTIRARKYENMLNVSPTLLVNVILVEEGVVSESFKGIEVWGFWLRQQVLLPILASTDRGILRETINSNLARTRHRDATINN